MTKFPFDPIWTQDAVSRVCIKVGVQLPFMFPQFCAALSDLIITEIQRIERDTNNMEIAKKLEIYL